MYGKEVRKLANAWFKATTPGIPCVRVYTDEQAEEYRRIYLESREEAYQNLCKVYQENNLPLPSRTILSGE